MDFLSKYKVMGLAVAFIMGIYLGTLVQTLVTGLVMPRIDLAIPGLGNLATFKTPVPQTELDSQGNPIDPNYVGQLFGAGEFLETLITFTIVAFVIFILVNPGKGHQKTTYRIISATLFFLLEHVFNRQNRASKQVRIGQKTIEPKK